MVTRHEQDRAAAPPTGVSATAVGVAVERAAESGRPDRLFDDPLAGAFVDAAGEDARSFWSTGAGAVLSAAMGDYVALRTRFFDEYIGQACAGGCRQVVLLAAGLDTRAYRLAWPAGVHLFELDRPEITAFKEWVLEARDAVPACERTVLDADLADDWPPLLGERGFRAEIPTAWLVEGVLVYLTEPDADRLLSRLTALSAPGSRLAVEFVSRPSLEAARTHAEAERSQLNDVVTFLASLWKNDMAGDPVRWLAGHGWEAEDRDLAALAHQHGRPVPPVFDPAQPHTARAGLLAGSRTTTGGPR